jgi:hypothetical protein
MVTWGHAPVTFFKAMFATKAYVALPVLCWATANCQILHATLSYVLDMQLCPTV